VFINRRINQLGKPSEDLNENEELNNYVNLIMEIVNKFNSNVFGRDVFNAIKYEVFVKKFVTMRHFRNATIEKHWEVLVEFQAELFSRVNLACPNLGIKDLAISHVLSKNVLFIPLQAKDLDMDE